MTERDSLGVVGCHLTWAGPHGPHDDCPGVTKPWWWIVRFYWREIKNIRRYRLTHDRPEHIPATRWRLIEYRFAWALTKRIACRKLS